MIFKLICRHQYTSFPVTHNFQTGRLVPPSLISEELGDDSPSYNNPGEWWQLYQLIWLIPASSFYTESPYSEFYSFPLKGRNKQFIEAMPTGREFQTWGQWRTRLCCHRDCGPLPACLLHGLSCLRSLGEGRGESTTLGRTWILRDLQGTCSLLAWTVLPHHPRS